MQSQTTRIWWMRGASLGVLAFIMLLYFLGALDTLQAQLTDRFFTVAPAPSDIILVTVDEATLAEVGQWPFSRATHARLLTELNQADIVAFDVIFSEPSALGPADDQALVEAIQNHLGTVVLAKVYDEQSGLITPPLPALAAVSQSGLVNTITARDGVVRFSEMSRNGNDSFDAAILRVEGAEPNYQAVERISYYGPAQTFTTFTYADVLAGRVPAALFVGKTVLVGASAAGLGDTYQTPFGAMPGVEVHANTIGALKAGKTLFTLDPYIILAVFLLITIVTYLVVIRLQILWQLVLAGLVIFVGIIVYAYVAFSLGHIVPHLYELILYVVLLGTLLLLQYVFETKEKAFIRRGFSQYVATEVVDELAKHPDKLSLGGETKTLSILFSDIRGFTTISEQLTPQELMQQLNEYLEEMSEAVMNRRGLVDKYIGDAVMAFWGAPLANPNQAINACESVLDMMAALAKLNERWAADGRPAFAIGVGISTGDVVVGNMGSKRRFNYSIIGDEVNFSARIEGLTKQYGVQCLIGESTYKAIKGAEHLVTRELDDVMVKGKKEPRRIYELITTNLTASKQQSLEHFAVGRTAYLAGDFKAAIVAFTKASAVDSTDGPAKVFLERSKALAAAPPAEWNGVFEFTTK